MDARPLFEPQVLRLAKLFLFTKSATFLQKLKRAAVGFVESEKDGGQDGGRHSLRIIKAYQGFHPRLCPAGASFREEHN